MRSPRVVITGETDSLTGILTCAGLLTPSEHVSVVAESSDLEDVRFELAERPEIQLIEPLPGRGACVLIPLARAFAHDARQKIVFLPACLGTADPYVLGGVILERLANAKGITVLAFSSSIYVVAGPVGKFWGLLRSHRPQVAAMLECYIDAIGTDYERTALTALEELDDVSLEDLLVKASKVEVMMLTSEMINRDRVLVARTPAVALVPPASGMPASRSHEIELEVEVDDELEVELDGSVAIDIDDSDVISILAS